MRTLRKYYEWKLDNAETFKESTIYFKKLLGMYIESAMKWHRVIKKWRG